MTVTTPLTPNEVLTIAGITVSFYAFFANILVKQKNDFSKILLLILLVNIISVSITVYNVLYAINAPSPFEPLQYIYTLSISWYISSIIVLFAIINLFVSDFKKIRVQKSGFKEYLYLATTYGATFIIFYYTINNISTEVYLILLVIFFFLYLIITNHIKTCIMTEDSKKTVQEGIVDKISPIDEIKKAKILLDNGIITDEEFVKIKKRYLEMINH